MDITTHRSIARFLALYTLPPQPPLLPPPHAPGPPPPNAPWQMLTALLRPGSPGCLCRSGSSIISSPLSTEGWFQKFSSVLGRAMRLRYCPPAPPFTFPEVYEHTCSWYTRFQDPNGRSPWTDQDGRCSVVRA